MISVSKLSKVFDTVKAVNNITFNVAKGDIFAFLGPNGAGKTTTIKMLTTLLHPTSGSVRLNGFDPLTQKDDVRKSFGIVFQDPSLDNELTAKENMEFHAALYGLKKEVAKERIDRLLKFVGLDDRAHDVVKNFSGGMKRRLEIARGLVHHPTILFLDEPTLGLDPQTRNHVWDYVKKLSHDEGMTVFFTTHYMEEAAKMAAKIAIIDKGSIMAQGTPEEIMKQTKTASLEQAFLTITGHGIREEQVNKKDAMRLHRRMWKG